MKNLIIAVAFFFSLLLSADESGIATAQKLEEKGEYAFAGEMLLDNVKESFSAKNCQLLLDFNARQLNRLSASITRRELTPFVVPKKPGMIERNKKSLKDILVVLISPLNPSESIAIESGLEIWLNHKATKEQREFISSLDNPVPDAEEVKQIMELYDVLKVNLLDLEKILKREIKKETLSMEITLPLLKKAREQKKTLKKDRTDYISFVVISPYLWETCRQLFLADSDYLAIIGRDKETLDNAVRVLAKACHKEWLYQADESVRKQFLDTMKVLKKIASTEEMEEYKVVTTLSDCMDSSKLRGADAWFK